MSQALPQYLLDDAGRVLLELSAGTFDDWNMIDLVRAGRVGADVVYWRHVAIPVWMGPAGWRAWRIEEVPDDGFQLGRMSRYARNWPLDGETVSDEIRHLGTVPPAAQRAPTWWSEDPATRREDGGTKVIVTGTVVDRVASKVIVDLDLGLSEPWRPEIPGDYDIGARLALANVEGMLWSAAHVRRLADVKLPGVV